MCSVGPGRGLNPHIEDVARRLALDNFIAFAPDALFPLGRRPARFNNNTKPRYNEAAATLAWRRTLAFLNQHLRG